MKSQTSLASRLGPSTWFTLAAVRWTGVVLLAIGTCVRAQTDTVTISAVEFQRMVYSAHLHTQLAEKPELDAALQVLIELQRRNPSAAPAALADLSRQALERYRSTAPLDIRTSAFRDEILATYLEALSQVPAVPNFVAANLSLLNDFMLGPADYNPDVAPATLICSLVNSGNQRLYSSGGETAKRQSLVDTCAARAQVNATFAAALDGLMSPETQVSFHASPAAIIGNTNSPLHENRTMQTLLALSTASGEGSLTISSNQLMNLFTAETEALWDTVRTNLALQAEINQAQPDLLAYLTNQAALAANAARVAAVQQGQGRRIASSTAAILVQSKLAEGTDPRFKVPKELNLAASALNNICNGIATGVALGVATGGVGAIAGAGGIVAGTVDILNLASGAESPEEQFVREIGNVKTLLEDLSGNLNYRFDRVDQSLTTIFDTLNTQLTNIVIIGGKVDHIEGGVDQIRQSLLDVHASLDRLERQLFTYFNEAQRLPLVSSMNWAMFYQIRNPNSGPMTWAEYSSGTGPENTFYTYATTLAQSSASSPSSFKAEDLQASALAQQLEVRPLDANLNYLKQFLSSTNVGQATAGTSPLSNPRDWFTGAYAYLQLAVENPLLFRKKGLTLPAIIAAGQNVADFCRSLTFNGATLNRNLYAALENHYLARVGPFLEQVSASEDQYAIDNHLALNTWRQWSAAAPRVTATATEVLPAAPKNLIAAGGGHSLALRADGRVVGWGRNAEGQTTIPVSATNVVALAAAEAHSLALRTDGTVVGWGRNDEGQTTIPVSATNVVAIAAGEAHSLALRADGTVVGWGRNAEGQTTIPVSATNGVAVAAGPFYSLALRTDGTVVGWGRNEVGQTAIPASATNVVALAAAEAHSLALRADGTVVGWGLNSEGQTTIPASATNVVAIAAGYEHSLALRTDGTVVGWGRNSEGQTDIPASATNVVAIAAGAFHSLALRTDGTAVGWGSNSSGQCTPRGWIASPRIRNHLAAGWGHSLALRADGTAVGWGYNSSGQTNIPAGLNDVVAIAADGDHNLALKANGRVVGWGRNNNGQTTIPASATNVVAVEAGEAYSLALRANGTVVGWGNNYYGQTTIPARATNVVAIAAGGEHSLALKADGTVVGWGAGSPGTSGDIHYGQATIPVGLSNVVAIAAGAQHSLALQADGTVVGWGYDSWGQADGSRAGSNVVAIAAGDFHSLALKADGTVAVWGQWFHSQPAGLSHVVAIAGGGQHSLALTAAGTILGWGSSSDGQTTIPANAIDLAAWGEDAPVQWNVPLPPSPITALTAGSAHSLALAADGSVLAWGLNAWGQTNVPAQAQSGVQAIASGLGHNVALTTSGAVLAWGLNDVGQTNVPASAQSLVVAISAGGKHNLALKTDGTVVGWGLNGSGQMSAPADVQGKVVAIGAGGEHSLALTASGTVWAWGGNSSGQINVPAEASSGVVAIAAGRYHNLALQSNGRVVAWGLNSSGQCNVPAAAQSGVVAIAAGITHSLALKADGTAVVWGSGPAASILTQTPSNLVAIAAGDRHSLLLQANPSSEPNRVPTLSFVRAQIPRRVVSLLRDVNDSVVAELGRAGELYDTAVALSGATALLKAVLELAMPYTLERDDVLHGFLYGSESLIDLEATPVFLEAENTKLQAMPDAAPVLLSDVAVLRYQRFTDRLDQCLANLEASGQPEIPRMVSHTLRLLNLLRDAWTQPENAPTPALEMWSENHSPRLLLYGEPYARYTLEYSDNLSAPVWTSTTLTNLLSEQPVSPPVSGNSQRFYRAGLPLP